MSFDSFHFDPSIVAGIQAMGFTEPTPIQEKTIPPILQGHDLIGLAQTGTGKTAAFVLPILQRLLNSPRGRVGALIVSPTRELAEQTCQTVNVLGKKTGLRSIAIYGGVSMEQQIRELRQGAEFVAACPGRLMDHLLKGTLDLSDVEVLVIDEADRMFDMGFLPDIRNIVRCLMKPHQTLLFSATMPDDIRRLVREVLKKPVTVQIGLSVPANTVSHALYPVKPHLKMALLKEILKGTKTESVLVFTRTKMRAERVAEGLKRAGLNVASLQGNLSQYERQDVLDAFREGYLKILVATDIAARGLDILSISHVINYDMPDTTDAYTHRIGRTGRINNTGEAFTLVTQEDEDMVKSLEKIFKEPLEKRTLPGFNYSTAEPKSGARQRPFSSRPSGSRRSPPRNDRPNSRPGANRRQP